METEQEKFFRKANNYIDPTGDYLDKSFEGRIWMQVQIVLVVAALMGVFGAALIAFLFAVGFN